MKHPNLLGAVSTCALALVSLSAHAALQSRLGGLVVYDEDQDLSWLANGNAGAGSVFDDGSNLIDGRFEWLNANAWAASLDIAGFSNWRLPRMDLNGDGTVVDCDTASATDCLDNEYGHLFYVSGIDTLNTGPFNSIQTNPYWSDTESAANSSEAWRFDFTFGSGQQGVSGKTFDAYAWAVHEGDIGTVPVPGAAWMLGSGLLGLLGFARRLTR